MLIVFAGLPGTGKSSVARHLASLLPATLVAVDPLDAAMRRAGVGKDQPTGLAAYVAAEAVAHAQLDVGATVVIDAVNDDERARQQWRDLATATGAALRWVEVRCSDRREHRRRLEARERDLAPLPEPGWASVEERRSAFDAWADERIVVDTMQSIQASLQQVLGALRPAMSMVLVVPGPEDGGALTPQLLDVVEAERRLGRPEEPVLVDERDQHWEVHRPVYRVVLSEAGGSRVGWWQFRRSSLGEVRAWCARQQGEASIVLVGRDDRGALGITWLVGRDPNDSRA